MLISLALPNAHCAHSHALACHFPFDSSLVLCALALNIPSFLINVVCSDLLWWNAATLSCIVFASAYLFNAFMSKVRHKLIT